MPRQAPEIVLGIATLVFTVAIVVIGRDTTFYRDDWFFVQYRDGHNAVNVFDAHGGHLSILPVLIYLGLFSAVGLDDYGVFRVVAALLVGLCAVLLFLHTRNRIGRWPAVGVAVLVLTLGPGWEDLLWSFQMGFVCSLAAGMGMLLTLDRDTGRSRCAAAGLLAASLASSGIGLMFAFGALVEVIGRGDRWVRIWVPGAPLILYLIWFALVGYRQAQTRLANLPEVPTYVMDSAAAVLSALTSLGPRYAPLLALAGTFLIVRRLGRGQVSLRLWAVLTICLSFWVSTAIARAQFDDPGASRYLLPGVIFTLLVAAEVAAPIRLRRGPLALVCLSIAAAATINFSALVAHGERFRNASAAAVTELGAIEALGEAGDPTFVAPGILEQQQVPVQAGPYLAAVERWRSSPALSLSQLQKASERLRRIADASMRGALALSFNTEVERPPVGGSLEVERVSGGRLHRRGRCIEFESFGPGGSVDFEYPPPGVRVKLDPGPEAMGFVRRLAGAFADNALVRGPTPGMYSTLRIPEDDLAKPWYVRLTTAQPLVLCRLAST